MPHDTALISTISVALALALVGGLIATRLHLPAIVGYLLAGVAVGPFTPGFVADTHLAPQLAEIGVILLMFGVGIHFSLRDLMAVRSVAVPGAIGQVAAATALAVGLALWWGWSLQAGLVLGLAISVASTVVLLRALMEADLLESTAGKIAVGWLIVEDLLMVLALVLLPVLAPSGETGGAVAGADVAWTVALMLGKVALLVGVMLVVGARVVPWLLELVARTGSRELFILAVLAVAFGIAFGSAVLFGVSLALGAFLAGLVVSESDLSHQAAEEALPLRDAFAVLFFVSVGMLFDPAFLLQSPWQVLAILAVIVVGKPLAAFLLVLLMRRPVRAGLVIAMSLGQIGEFSFILAEMGRSLGMLPAEGYNLVLAGALLSITLNPLLFRSIAPIEAWLGRRGVAPEPAEAPVLEAALAGRRGHVVVCGYGRVGRTVAEALARHGVPYLVVDQDRVRAEDARRAGHTSLHGDALERNTLRHLGLAEARLLVLAIPDPIVTRQIVTDARQHHSDLPIVARTHSHEELARLEALGVDAVLGEREVALAMTARGLGHLDADRTRLTGRAAGVGARA